MPRIPIVTAQQGPGVLQLPAVQRQTGFEEVVQLGERMATIQGHIQRQQDDLDLFRTLTDTEIEIKQRQMDVSADTDYATQAERFQKSAKEVMFRKLGTLRSPSVAAVYQSRAERMIAEAGIHVEVDASKRQIAQQGAETLTLGEQAATRWIEATPEQRDGIKQEWFDLVDRSLAFTPEQKNKKKAQWDEWTALESIRVNPTEALAALSKGAFPELDPKQRETMMRSAEIAEARQERQIEHESRLQREEQNNALYDKLRNNTLQWSEVRAAGFLSREDREFFWQALKGGDQATDPTTAVRIQTLLDTPKGNREQQVKNATAAKQLAQTAYIKTHTLEKSDAMRMIQAADHVIAGGEPESDEWFKTADAYLKDKFGWQGGIVGRFLNPEGGARYWALHSQLLQEREQNPLLRGKALYDRAIELGGPEAVNYYSGQATAPTGKGEQKILRFDKQGNLVK